MMTVAKRVLLSLPLGLILGWGHYAAAQSGPVDFTVTAAALTGTVTCPDGTVVTLTPVDPSTTSANGSGQAAEEKALVTACGNTIYQADKIDDTTDASDTTSLDDADGQNIVSKVIILGSLVIADSENGPVNCTAQPPVTGQIPISCSGTGTIKKLALGGNPIAPGDYAGGTTFDIADAQVPSSSCTTGVESFTGKLILADSTLTNNNSTSPSTEVDWLHLTGQSVCAPTGALTKYDIRDLSLVRGRIQPHQNVLSGAYTDTILVTVTF